MPTLTIKNIPDPVHSALSVLAAQDGLSIEDEVCRILILLCQITCSEQTKIPPTLRQAQGEWNFSLLNRVFDNLTK
jgi:plasmid stability protein